MTRIEFHACDAENEILRDRLNDNRKTAQRIMRGLPSGGGYMSKSQLKSLRDQLKRIAE